MLNEAKQQSYQYELLTKNNINLLNEFDKEAEKLHRLRAILSQWLRMENMCLLIGSGASLTHKGLLLPKLESTILDDIEHASQDEGIKKLIAWRKRNNNNQNFEEWLSSVSTAYFLLDNEKNNVESISWELGSEKISFTKDQLKTFLQNIQKGVFEKCSLKLPRPSEKGGTGHHSLVGKLVARDPTMGRAHIFTLNYDTLIEQALDHLSVSYMDGFSGKIEAAFDPASYGLDIYYPGNITEGRVKRYERFLHLYKLHGSINWYFTKDNQLIRKEYERGSANISLGIMPTSNKFSQTQLAPYSHLFRLFQGNLHQSQTFFLIAGYGFGDEHVNRIIDDAMLGNSSLLMLVIDPFPGEKTKQHIEAYNVIGERAFLFTLSESEKEKRGGQSPVAFLDEFAKNILPDVKWLDEWFKLRKLEKSIENTMPPESNNMMEGDDAN